METEAVGVQEIGRQWFHWSLGGQVNAMDPSFQFTAVWVASNAFYAWAYGPSRRAIWRDRLCAIRSRGGSKRRGKPGDKEKAQLFSAEESARNLHVGLLKCSIVTIGTQ